MGKPTDAEDMTGGESGKAYRGGAKNAPAKHNIKVWPKPTGVSRSDRANSVVINSFLSGYVYCVNSKDAEGQSEYTLSHREEG